MILIMSHNKIPHLIVYNRWDTSPKKFESFERPMTTSIQLFANEREEENVYGAKFKKHKMIIK